MNFAEYLEKINKAILDKELVYQSIASNIKPIYLQNLDYLRDYMINYHHENIKDLVQSSNKNEQSLATLVAPGIIYKDLDNLKHEILELKKEKSKAISQFLTNSMLSIKDAIWLLDQFGIYYKQIKYGGQTLLVPQDFVLLNRVENGQNIDNQANDMLFKNYGVNVANMFRKDIDKIATLNEAIKIIIKQDAELKDKINLDNILVKSKDGIKINEQVLDIISLAQLREIISKIPQALANNEVKIKYQTALNDRLVDLAAVMMVDDLAGIQVYLPAKEDIKLNSKILNIFPPQVLGFVLEYIEAKNNNETLSLEEYYQSWNNKKVK